MLRDRAAAAAIAIVVAAGCSFQVSATGDGGGTGDDAAVLPTVGFVQPTSTQDESSGAVMVAVQLSEPAPGPVTVAYSFGGDAIQGSDYAATAGTLTFGAGETTTAIELTITNDTDIEANELIVISLESPTGAELGAATHTITISADILPRVTLTASTSTVTEQTPVTITFVLDKPANGPVSVDYSVGGGTAQPSGAFADYTLASGVVTFPTGSVMETLPLGVVNDTRNEVAETLNITLTTTTGLVIGTTGQQVHTITDNDPTPNVRFAPASSNTNEGDTGVTVVALNVTLSAASGRTVIVPFTMNAAGTTATDPGDYSLVGTSITFTEGVTMQSILVNVVGDTVNELDKALVIDIAAPVDGAATLGAQPTRTLNINDNDPWCHGTGAFRVCYNTTPTTPVVLPANIDTDGSAPCEAAQPTGWTGGGQPTVCVVRGTTITQSGTTTVTGSRPLVLAATTSISIATLDVSSRRGDSNLGPASPSASAQCSGFLRVPGINAGGAGGSFLSIGGDGGIGPGSAFSGRAADPVAAPAALRGGCHGQVGSNGDETGKGGGAVYLVTGGTLSISGGINASGSSGRGGTSRSGGSGAGSGGMIVLFAASISANTAAVIANGGGGASGGDNNTNGNDGSDPSLATPTTPAAGGPAGGGGGAGGAGFAGGIQATAGAGTGNPNDGGGGGGGGGGYVKSNLVLTGATVSAGRIDVP